MPETRDVIIRTRLEFDKQSGQKAASEADRAVKKAVSAEKKVTASKVSGVKEVESAQKSAFDRGLAQAKSNEKAISVERNINLNKTNALLKKLQTQAAQALSKEDKLRFKQRILAAEGLRRIQLRNVKAVANAERIERNINIQQDLQQRLKTQNIISKARQQGAFNPNRTGGFGPGGGSPFATGIPALDKFNQLGFQAFITVASAKMALAGIGFAANFVKGLSGRVPLGAKGGVSDFEGLSPGAGIRADLANFAAGLGITDARADPRRKGPLQGLGEGIDEFAKAFASVVFTDLLGIQRPQQLGGGLSQRPQAFNREAELLRGGDRLFSGYEQLLGVMDQLRHREQLILETRKEAIQIAEKELQVTKSQVEGVKKGFGFLSAGQQQTAIDIAGKIQAGGLNSLAAGEAQFLRDNRFLAEAVFGSRGDKKGFSGRADEFFKALGGDLPGKLKAQEEAVKDLKTTISVQGELKTVDDIVKQMNEKLVPQLILEFNRSVADVEKKLESKVNLVIQGVKMGVDN